MGVGWFTCANEEHMIHLICCLDLMDSNLCVSSVSFQQEGLAADHAVH